MYTSFCPECGTENPPNAKFCYECGIRLSEDTNSAEKIPETSEDSQSDLYPAETKGSDNESEIRITTASSIKPGNDCYCL